MARIPAKSDSAPAPPASAVLGSATASERKNHCEQLAQRLLRLLAPLRVQTLSLHNDEGELLWLSEGVFGPDEHALVLDALDLFVLEGARAQIERTLEDGRRAVFLCARNPLGERCGLAMAVVETRTNAGRDGEALTPAVAKLMRQFSMMLAPPIDASRAARARSAARPEPKQPAAATLPATAAAFIAAAPERASAYAGAAAPIHARRYARLRSGGSTRRYEVSTIADASAAHDLDLSLRVIEYLKRMRDRDQQELASFSIPLSAASVRDADFLKQLAPQLRRARLKSNVLGFCLPVDVWSATPALAAQFIDTSGALGCFAALDDFNLIRPGFSLLRSGALRCLKLDAELIAAAMNDKFSQACVFATTQAARVLGLYCVAKGVEDAAQARWLAGAGIEFSDSISRGGTTAATTKNGELMTLEVVS